MERPADGGGVGEYCGNGVCAAPRETTETCPSDCPAPPVCGDGVCTTGEACTSCPADCGTCPPPCDATELGALSSVDIAGSSSAAPAQRDTASCGDGATGPTLRYQWIAPDAGRYTISVGGGFVVVLDARFGTCYGAGAGCATAAAGQVASVDIGAQAGQAFTIAIAGQDGASGDFHLRVTREPDACGDQVCEASESCSACETDCGACAPTPTCGDGVCDAGEDCGSCASDCGACMSYCGDGTCDADEDCDSCEADCGTCD